MANMLDEKVKAELKLILSKLKAPVRLVFFKQKSACPTCDSQEGLLLELCALTDMLKLELHDLVLDGDAALNYKVDKAPATAVVGARD